MSVSSAEPEDKDMGQGLCTNLPEDPFKHTKVKFSLFDPIASSDWQLYNKECNSAGEIMENIEGDLKVEPFVSAVRDGIHSALGSDLIGNEDCEKIVNAVPLTHCNITWEDIDQVSHLYFSLPYLAR